MAKTLPPAAKLIEALVKQYGGVLAEQYAEELADLECTLCTEWPTWNDENPNKRAFRHLPFPAIGRIKWLLKKRSNILRGLGQYGVRLVYKPGKKGEQGLPFAILVKPRHAEAGPSEEADAHHKVHVDLGQVSIDLDLPIEEIEAALGTWLGKGSARAHVRAHVRKAEKAKARAEKAKSKAEDKKEVKDA